MGRHGKRADVIVHEEEPFNAETGLGALAEGPLTATDAFYVRGHGAVPEIDPGTWRLRVHGLVERELDLSLATLREAFREREVTATLQCAGNRRAGLIAIRDIPGEAPWGPGATGTATWSGVALADVLAVAGPRPEAAHAGFDGADVCPEAKPVQRFGGSIPLDKACRPEVLLAWAMNGESLAAVHGAPLRVVVPGYIGARSVKWLERIEVRSRPWQGYFQQVVYRLLPEDGTVAPGAGMPLGLVALNADVLSPADGATVAGGAGRGARLRVRGRRAARRRVDVSVDGAATWSQAELLDDLGPLGVAALADHGRARAGRARDPRPRLGLLGRDAARGRGGAVESEGLRQQRAAAGPGASGRLEGGERVDGHVLERRVYGERDDDGIRAEPLREAVAPTTLAPVEMPPKIPSSRERRSIISSASPSSIASTWSTFWRSHCGTTNPAQPCMANAPRAPPPSAADRPARAPGW